VLALPDGRFVHPRAVWEVFKEIRDVLQYQLIEREAERFELTLVTLDEPRFHAALERASPALRRLLGSGAVIDARWRSEIERGGRGKFRAVVACRR
jgi:hypothetical protein